MGKYKAKSIQADLGIFTHITAYSDISRHIQVYSEPCVTLTYSEPDAYREPWQIQNQTRIQNLGIFRTLALFRTLVCSKPWHILNQRHVNGPTPEHFSEIVNIFYEIDTMNVLNSGVIFTPIAFILRRKSVGSQWAGAMNFDIP